MTRFPGLDGLRGWLAWTVVLHHILFFTGLGASWLPPGAVMEAGMLAVMIFVILSGFVITHLIIEKDEPYGPYLARRALRIYPIYLLALLMGIGATFLTFRTFLTPGGVADPVALATIPYPQIDSLRFDRAALQGGAYFTHLALHLTMLQGIFAQSFLPDAAFMFLAPAWSLSLEWQFYLVAPFVVRASRRVLPAIGLALATLAVFYLFSLNLFGWWGLPSFLPGASLYFAIGIASRLLITGEPLRFSWRAAPAAILAIGFLVMGAWKLPAEVWLVFLAASLYRVRGSTFGRPIHRVFGVLFESRLARHLGEASYSTYLVHLPLLQIAMYLAIRVLALGPANAILFVAFGTLVSTYALSQLTYRFVELPFIARGKRWARQASPKESPAISST